MKLKRTTAVIAALMAIILQPAHSQGQNLEDRIFLWENPAPLATGARDCRFPQTLNSSLFQDASTEENAVPSMIFWEEVNAASSTLTICASSSQDGLNWSQAIKITDSISYSGEIPEIYSTATDGKSTMVLAALTSGSDITVFNSTDKGATWNSYSFEDYGYPLTAPRIYASSQGFMLFASLAKNEEFSIIYAKSPDGIQWSEFEDFTPAGLYQNSSSPFVPFLLDTGSGDMVVYQARYAYGDQLSFQLFSTVTQDNGASWSQPVMLTDSKALLDSDEKTFDNYNNQRPFLARNGSQIYMAWERKPFNVSTTDIICATLTPQGKLYGIPSRLNERGNCSRPILFEFKDNFYALWFDSLRGNESINLAKKQPSFWDDPEELAKNGSIFPSPVISNNGQTLGFTWQENTTSGKIMQLIADHSSRAPKITPTTFTSGKRYAQEKASIKIASTEDSSGVRGFSYIWTQDPEEEPLEELTLDASTITIENRATEEGTWYFKARQQDFAGNWSPSATVTFIKDTTPPLPPVIAELKTDSYGLASSNTFTLYWQGDESDTDIAGYTWSLEYIDSIPQRLAVNDLHPLQLGRDTTVNLVESIFEKNESKALKLAPPPRYARGNQNKKSLYYSNIRNGVYVFSVAAIDTVGNIGEATKYTFIANKYKPSTYITTLDSQADTYGNISLDIIGGGFTYEGTINAIYLDRDGKAPFDYILTAQNNDFTVSSDSRITDIHLSQINADDYKIGLLHSDRGLYFTQNPIFTVVEYGTVKNKYSFTLEETWKAIQSYYAHNTSASRIVLVLLLVFFVIAFMGSFAGLVGTAREASTVRKEITALIQGDIMPNERNKKAKVLKRKGLGLRSKLSLNSMTLVIVINIALILVFRMLLTRSQEQTLSKGLYDRVNVMMNSIDSGARVYMPLNDNLSLQDTVNQISALEEAEYATITGFAEDGSTTAMDYVWATTDSDIQSKVDTDIYEYGTSRLVAQEYAQIIDSLTKELNERAIEAVGDIPQQLSEVTIEATSLAGKSDEESILRRQELDTIRKQLTQRMDHILSELSVEASGSTPVYDSSVIDRETRHYLFYKPLLYRHGSDQNYVHGITFIAVSTDSLILEMDNAEQAIIRISLIMLAVAIAIALISSIILSAIIIRPINKLVLHVAMIRDTEDKEKLNGKDIKIKSRDEIGMLGETVNQMTRGLVEAAVASKNLTIGKEVQTKFIPLEQDSMGNTLTTGSLKANGATFFSYYAGADDLSGDYFDYKQIDQDHYAIIKCDVSGHGVPAALIMVEVATLFLNSFQHWSMKNPAQGINLAPVVGQINDLLESRGFKGRFAAFTLAIMNTRTGECWFCNAGDNLVHIYDGQTRKKKVITLQETPAAGMFSTDLVDMKGGYKVSKIQLKKDDVLFLYTDGIEEAKRLYRKDNYELLVNKETASQDEEDGEEMSPERVTQIIETVFAQGRYVLTKKNDPDQEKELVFDFTNCQQTAEEAIMALVSVEQVFRMYKPKNPNPWDKVKVDAKIDQFLKLHFKQYGTYCSERSPVENDPNSLYYNGVLEDPQYDDLTLIGIKKD